MSNTGRHNHEAAGHSGVTIRAANGDDRAELARLAELDTARLPAGPMLVANVGGELQAAYSVTERRAIANPFRRTAELVELLAMRAKQLNRDGHRRRRRGSTAPQPPGLGLGFPPPRLDRRAA